MFWKDDVMHLASSIMFCNSNWGSVAVVFVVAFWKPMIKLANWKLLVYLFEPTYTAHTQKTTNACMFWKELHRLHKIHFMCLADIISQAFRGKSLTSLGFFGETANFHNFPGDREIYSTQSKISNKLIHQILLKSPHYTLHHSLISHSTARTNPPYLPKRSRHNAPNVPTQHKDMHIYMRAPL